MMTGTQVCVGSRQYPPDRLQTADAGHFDIHQDQFGRLFAKRCDGRLAAGDEADLVPVAAQLPADHFTNRGAVIGKKNAQSFHYWRFARVLDYVTFAR